MSKYLPEENKFESPDRSYALYSGETWIPGFGIWRLRVYKQGSCTLEKEFSVIDESNNYSMMNQIGPVQSSKGGKL